MKNGKNKMKVSVVEESSFGLYVWLTDEGSIVADDSGNYLNIEAMKGDEKKIELLKQAARECGIEGGKAAFMSGYRRVTDEEYAYQKQRMDWGLIPDELDLPAFKEEAANIEKMKKKGLKLTDEF